MYSFVFIVLYVFGSFGACLADIDVNRIHLFSAEDSQRHPYNTQVRRSLKNNLITRTHDYDDYSSGYSQLRPPHFIPSQATTGDQEKNTLKVHQSREDPKLFYQSESYLKEINDQNFSPEVASIYPGKEVIRAIESHPIPKSFFRSGRRNHISSLSSKICIKCPHDRTLVAKKGVDRVVLQTPKLTTCSGRKAPSNIHFTRMYGSKFGTLIQQGSHVIVGRIMHKNKTLQLCKMQVHVIIQSCPTPKYLISHCDDNRICNFTCHGKTQELDGESQYTCGEDLTWLGKLPKCRARNWCYPPPPAENGRISCKSATAWKSLGLTEGSRCRVRCSPGWRWDRSVTVCRRGSWTNSLKCILKNNTNN